VEVVAGIVGVLLARGAAVRDRSDAWNLDPDRHQSAKSARELRGSLRVGEAPPKPDTPGGSITKVAPDRAAREARRCAAVEREVEVMDCSR